MQEVLKPFGEVSLFAPTMRGPNDTEIGHEGLTKLTSGIKRDKRSMKKVETLAQEADKFVKTRTSTKVKLHKEKPLSLREYRIGQALTGLLSRSQGYLSEEDMRSIIEEANKIADMMSEY